MALTRRRQPRKAVGTQILCKRTRSPARGRARENASSCLYSISDEYRASSYRADTTTYMHAPSVCTFAVIGYRLYRVQQPYGAQTRQLGMWVTYRNRALSNPIPLHRTPSSAFHHRVPRTVPPFSALFFSAKGVPFSPSILRSSSLLSQRGEPTARGL